MLHGRLVHELETLKQICKFWAVNGIKMRLVAGTRWGSYSAPADLLAVIRLWGGNGKERVGNRRRTS